MLVATLALSIAPEGASHNGNIHLSITGDEQTRFTGKCTITVSTGNETFTLGGSVPSEHAWDGEAIACEITQASTEGTLEVVLSKDGNRTRSRTQGQGSVVRLNVR